MKEQKVTDFGRFWCAFRALKVYGDREEAKRGLVLQYTGGRTESLKEMTWKEYGELCAGLERMTGGREELRRERSVVLKLMQEVGVDTTDWSRINDFCSQPRIAGKEFSKLTPDELREMAVRLRTMKRKGWTRKQDAWKRVYVVNIFPATGPSMN